MTEAGVPEVPDHVPRELVWYHSFAAFTNELEDPYLAACRLHAGPEIVWARDAAFGQPGWIITRDALLREAFLDPGRFSSEGGFDLTALLGVDWKMAPIGVDPPRHTAYRKLLSTYFTPKAVNQLEASVTEACGRLIDSFKDRGHCEFVGEFSSQLPTYIFLTMMGMPQDRAPQFLEWEEQFLRGSDMHERQTAALSILEYLTEFLREQRKHPTTELMAGILDARVDGAALDDGEILGFLHTLYIGGLDTVTGTLGWSMWYLATHPELQRHLRDNPAELSRAVDELARLFSVVTTMRNVTEDCVFHGVRMRAGDLVILPTALGSRDPSIYPNPHEADLGRGGGILAFGTGPHLCLGIHLARRELRIAIGNLLMQFDDIHVPAGEACSFHGAVTFGVDRLPLAWKSR